MLSGPRNPRARSTRRSFSALAAAALAIGVAGCASPGTDASANPSRYRLTNSGTHWDVSQGDRVFDDVGPRYPEFFAIILDPAKARVPSLRTLRDDLERAPADRRNYDALNTIAIGYFETNYRAESDRGDGLRYLALSHRSVKLLAVPWRAYGETDEPALRSAILDFFEDAGSGQKLHTARTAPRLVRIVASLAKKEHDEIRLARIRALTIRLEEKTAALLAEPEAP